MKKRREERIEAEKIRKKQAAEKAERDRIRKMEQEKLNETKRLEDMKRRAAKREADQLKKEEQRIRREKQQRKRAWNQERKLEAQLGRQMYDEHQMQRGSGRSAFSMSHLSSHQDMRQAEGIAGRHGKTSTKAARRAATRKSQTSQVPRCHRVDLIPEGKLIATVYKPPPLCKDHSSCKCWQWYRENVTGNANIQSSVSASAPAKEGFLLKLCFGEQAHMSKQM